MKDQAVPLSCHCLYLFLCQMCLLFEGNKSSLQTLCLCLCLYHCLFDRQVMSPHHSDQWLKGHKSLGYHSNQMSQISKVL